MFKLSETDVRPIQELDLAFILDWRNSDRIRQNMFTNDKITWEQHNRWFETLQHRTDQEVLLFSLIGQPVGVVNFTQINKAEKSCEWGFYVGSEDAPRGSGTAMGILALDYAFNQLHVHRVIGQCFEFNAGSVRYHEKLGFIYLGLSDTRFEREGFFYNIKRYELTDAIWKKRRRELYPEVFVDFSATQNGGDSFARI